MRNPNTLNELFGCHSALGRNYPKPVPERRLEPNRSRVAVDYHLAWFNVRQLGAVECETAFLLQGILAPALTGWQRPYLLDGGGERQDRYPGCPLAVQGCDGVTPAKSIESFLHHISDHGRRP